MTHGHSVLLPQPQLALAYQWGDGGPGPNHPPTQETPYGDTGGGLGPKFLRPPPKPWKIGSKIKIFGQFFYRQNQWGRGPGVNGIPTQETPNGNTHSKSPENRVKNLSQEAQFLFFFPYTGCHPDRTHPLLKNPVPPLYPMRLL